MYTGMLYKMRLRTYDHMPAEPPFVSRARGARHPSDYRVCSVSTYLNQPQCRCVGLALFMCSFTRK